MYCADRRREPGSCFFKVVLILIFGKFQGIPLSSFLDQYILYPQTIGAERLENFNFTFGGVVGHFKFIYLSIISLILSKLSSVVQIVSKYLT